MARLLAPLLLAAITSLTAQNANPLRTDVSRLQESLGFEQEQKQGGFPAGWGGTPDGTIFADDKLVHGGRWSARIERNSTSGFSTITQSIPVDFAGKTIELHGFVRTEDVSEFVGLWMREDGDDPQSLAFDNMQQRQVKGTSDWKEYSIVLPIHAAARQLYFGFLLAGSGKAWVDDLRLLVDGKPVWEAPKVERPKTPLDLDAEFDRGSRVSVDTLTSLQIESLATLGKVWGFIKYHHPLITSGKRHWDYELLRVLPSILNAPDRASANAALLRWVTDLGPAACTTCATLNTSVIHLRPHTDWISSEALLGAELSSSLRAIHANRSTGKQFYVSQDPNIGNPVFDHELPYRNIRSRDAGFQLLALYRYWNIIEYWFPYRDVLGEDWDRVLTEFIPKMALAKNFEDSQRELMALIARAHDTHSNLWSSLQVRPPTGACQLPVAVRFVEDEAVIAGTAAGEPAMYLHVGDVLLELDGKPIGALVSEWTPYYADSNDAARRRDMARFMTRGVCGEATVRLRRQSETLEINARRVPAVASSPNGSSHDLPGETFRLLSPEVAYLKLSSVKAADAARYIESAAKTKGLVIDIRNYPSEFMVFALGELLVDKETPFARFTAGDLSNPGAFHWRGEPISLKPRKPHYAGKVVILVDEASQSQAEYTAMAFRAAPKAIIVGSTTAGADGNVSNFPLPGGLSSMISGIGVFYPNKRPTQRVGIALDLLIQPTIAGLRDGRDEVLEAALRQILGPAVTAARIQEIAKL